MMTAQIELELRPLDDWLRPRQEWVRSWAPWLTPNMITSFRLLIFLPLSVICFTLFDQGYLPLAIFLCYCDGSSDVHDGAWANNFNQKSDDGQFLDQAVDKATVWIRVALLWWFMRETVPLPLDPKIWGYSVFWGTLLVSFVFDLANFVRRTIYRLRGQKSRGAPSKWGKRKVWCQAYGITLFTIIYTAHVYPHQSMVIAATLLTCVSAIGLIPPRKGRHWWKDARWYALATVNIILTTLGLLPALSDYAFVMGQFAFMASVYCAYKSATDQARATAPYA